jgi:hypothetical protein
MAKWFIELSNDYFFEHVISVKFQPPSSFDSFQKTQKRSVFLKSIGKNQTINIESTKVIKDV